MKNLREKFKCLDKYSPGGCDAFAGCCTIQEFEELALRLESSVIWKSKKDMFTFIKERDWEGQYLKPKRFIKRALAELKE